MGYKGLNYGAKPQQAGYLSGRVTRARKRTTECHKTRGQQFKTPSWVHAGDRREFSPGQPGIGNTMEGAMQSDNLIHEVTGTTKMREIEGADDQLMLFGGTSNL